MDDHDLKPERVELASNDNAFFILQEGGSRLQWPQENRPQLAGMAESNPRWPWDSALAEDLLARNQGVLELMGKALAVGKLQVPVPKTFDEDYTYLSSWGAMAMLASIQCGVFFREGREEDALGLACKLLDLGHLIENSGGVEAHYRRGWTAKRNGLARLRQMVGKTTLPTARWKAILRRLDAAGPDPKALTNVFKVMYQVEARDVEGFGAGKLPGTNQPDRVTRAISRPFGLPMLKVAATKNLFAQCARAGLKGIPCHYAEMPFNELPRLPERSSLLRRVMRGNVVGELYYSLAEPSVGGMLALKCRENATVVGTQLVIALRCYQLEHGSLPDSLDALVPEYFEHVPTDDFDGKPFRYSRAKRIIYSVESDLVDDGGLTYKHGRPTYDLVFELGF